MSKTDHNPFTLIDGASVSVSNHRCIMGWEVIEIEKLRRDIRDYFAKIEKCYLPCACLRNPQYHDCGTMANRVINMILNTKPFDQSERGGK